MKRLIKPHGIGYLGSKSAYVDLFPRVLGEGAQVDRYCDLTAGSCIVPLFFREWYGTREFILNDASAYPRMIADVFFVQPRWPLSRLAEDCVVLPVEGWASQSSLYYGGGRRGGKFKPETLRWMDGFCEENRHNPRLLVSLAACISKSAEFRPCAFYQPHTSELTPASLARAVLKQAVRLNGRSHASSDCRITHSNYLDLDQQFDGLEDYVVYLDAAWPTQPGAVTMSNAETYGFYASTLMSLLQQKTVPWPEEYNASESESYAGLRDMIDRLRVKNTVLLAYQSKPHLVERIRDSVLHGIDARFEGRPRKTSSGKVPYWEYLWRIE